MPWLIKHRIIQSSISLRTAVSAAARCYACLGVFSFVFSLYIFSGGVISKILTTAASQFGNLSRSSALPRTALTAQLQLPVTTSTLPVRAKHFDHHFVNRWMKRDYYKRKCVQQHGHQRIRYLVMKRSSILPKELRDVAGEELQAFPKNSNFTRLKPRCIITSRPRWVIRRYRLSRIQWRMFADYNKLSGWHRACW